MKQILLIVCIMMLFVCCAPRKATVKTEGLEEVVVFGEEESLAEEAPVEEVFVPSAEVAPAEEEIVLLPSPTEEIIPPPVEEVTYIPPSPVEEEIVLPPPVEEEIIPLPPVEEVTYIPPTTSTVPTPPSPTVSQKVYGFRVQLFASSTEKSASRVAADARTGFKENIYVEYIPPYYKVRVGDCLTKEDAIALKSKALKLGYRGAFVIETMIAP